MALKIESPNNPKNIGK